MPKFNKVRIGEALKKVELMNKFETLRRTPIVDKVGKVAVPLASAYDIRDSVTTAVDPSKPIGQRLVCGIRASCCTLNLISAYYSKAAVSPKTRAAFRLCCYGFGFGYYLAGGDIGILLGIQANL